jgi:hypothetical protein
MRALLIWFLLLPSVVLPSVVLPSAAHAEMSANELLAQYAQAGPDKKELLKIVVSSNENGMQWVNTFLDNRGQQRVYCSPPTSALTGEQVLDIVAREIKNTPNLGNQPYGLAILVALRKAFPCPAAAPKSQ